MVWLGADVLQSPLHGQGTYAPPAAVKAARRLLDGVALCVGGAGVAVVEKHLAQVQHRRYSCTVVLNVPLELLEHNKRVGTGPTNVQHLTRKTV